MGRRPAASCGRSPTFPYPLRPRYTGAGDMDQAQSYVPGLPAVSTRDDLDWLGKGLVSGYSK